jgi:hypothetical protein
MERSSPEPQAVASPVSSYAIFIVATANPGAESAYFGEDLSIGYQWPH